MKTQIKLLLIAALLSVSLLQAQEGLIGEIRMFAGHYEPRGWAFCNGQLLAISSNPALFSILGTRYGGDGRTTFALPDLRGRVAVSPGKHPGSYYDYRLGKSGGAESRTLNIMQMPSHNHSVGANSKLPLSADDAVREVPLPGDVPAVANYPDGLTSKKVKSFGPPTNLIEGGAISGSSAIGNTGNNQSFDVRQPYTVVNYIICLYGIFPPRN